MFNQLFYKLLTESTLSIQKSTTKVKLDSIFFKTRAFILTFANPMGSNMPNLTKKAQNNKFSQMFHNALHVTIKINYEKYN